MSNHCLNFKNLLIISYLILSLIGNSVEEVCGESMTKKVDGIVAKLITVGNSGRKFPSNKANELKKFCEDSKSYVQQIENYKNKCLKDLPKQASGLIIYSIKNSINQLCKRDSKRLTDLIDSTLCMNKGSIEFNKCYTKYIDAILGAKFANDSKKIPYNCCSYFKIFSCAETRLKKFSECSTKRIESGLDFVRSIFGNMVDFVCGEYTENSDSCEKLGPAPPKRKCQRRTKSFMIPLIDLLSSFPEV